MDYKLDLSKYIGSTEDYSVNINDEVINQAVEHICKLNEKNAEQAVILHQESKIFDLEYLLGELYQILGQFQDEIPEIVLDKISAAIHYEDYDLKQYPDLLPWYRSKQ